MATAAYTTVVDRSVGDPLTEAIWDDQLKDNVNMLLGKGSGNLLVNGGFEVWQRGTGSFTANQAYTADRWLIDGTVLTVTKETTTVDNSIASLKVVVAAYAGPTIGIGQYLEENKQLYGKTLSFSVRVHQSVASQVSIAIREIGVGATTSSTSVTTGSFVTYTVTRTLGSSFTSINPTINFTGNGTYYLDNAMLVIGPNAAPYEPLHPADDLLRCQRYYEFIGGAAQSVYFRGYHTAGNPLGFTLFWKTTKGGTPTITKIGTWTVGNCAQPAVASPAVNSCQITSTVTASGDAYFTTSSATDGITVEWNP